MRCGGHLAPVKYDAIHASETLVRRSLACHDIDRKASTTQNRDGRAGIQSASSKRYFLVDASYFQELITA